MEARLSVDYFTRKEMMSDLKVPTLSDAKLKAGLPLSLILFEECHPDLSEDFGLKPYLQGARGELWTSPSDLLIGKVALKPPLTQKHVQALTHEGILDLGIQIEQKLLNEKRMEREKAVSEREDYLTRMYEAKRVELIQEVKEAEEQKYSTRINDMQEFYENQICQLLWECYDQVQQLQDQMQIEADSLNVLWQAKLEDEIGHTVKRITEEFMNKMARQEKILANTFNKKVGMATLSKKNAIEIEKAKCKEMLIQMKHKLQCENISNLMYLLCKERRKCKTEKNEIQDDFKTQTLKYKQNINKKSFAIGALNRAKNKKTKQLNVRDRCLSEILRQFQKFIYFALKAAPTQGEFLLNINKLIKFELEDYRVPNDQPKAEIKDTAGMAVTEKPDTDIHELLSVQSLSVEEERPHSDALPAFYFNNKMYVREDFRDMLNAGIEIGAKNSLWNEDVEELMKIFRESIDDKRNCQIGKVKSHHSSVHFSVKSASNSRNVLDAVTVVLPPRPHLDSIPGSNTTTHEKTISEAQPQHKEPLKMANSPTMNKSLSVYDADNETEIRKVSLGESSIETSKNKKQSSAGAGVKRYNSRSPDSHTNGSEIRSDAPGNSLNTPSRLTLARDSVILTMSTAERKSLQAIYKTLEDAVSNKSNGEKEIFKAVNEGSTPGSPVEDARSAKSLEEQTTGITSKLLLATDSYEIIKSTIAVSSSGEHKESSGKQEKRKSQLTFSPKVEAKQSSSKIRMKQNQTKGTKQNASSQKRKVVPQAKVVGSPHTREHEQPIDEFTNERITSLVNIMKENPSLIRLFTPCLK